uniref:exodeoxyribonuclease III n=1 Tax=Equus caballus TaxID=9796 RepID=A0A9L0S3G5_HORSE
MQQNRKMSNRMTALSSHASILTLNVNGLNSPIKRHRVAKCIKEQDPTICCLQETHLTSKDKYRLREKGWKTILQANSKQKKAGVAILISDKTDCKIKQVKRDREGQYIMTKGHFITRNNAYKYLCTQHRSTKVHKATINKPKRRYQK